MLIAVPLFIGAAIVVLLVGPRMARTADDLSEATGLGGAMFGVVFLSIATDLPEVALTPTAVLGGTPRIAVGGLLGSAAAQLLLIAVVDMAFRKGRLAQRVSMKTSLGQCALMMAVLAVPLMAAAGSPSAGGISVGMVVLTLAYLGILAGIRGIEPEQGPESPSQVDEAAEQNEDEAEQEEVREEEEQQHDSLRSLWLRFGGFAALLTAAGVALESATETIGSTIGLSETAAGALLAGVVTSLPELVTAVAAARNGALELAVGDLVGSSALDVALLAFADAFYTEGSIFELLGRGEITLIGMALALTSLLVVGLVRREPVGSRRVAVESYMMVAVYVAGAANLVATGG